MALPLVGHPDSNHQVGSIREDDGSPQQLANYIHESWQPDEIRYRGAVHYQGSTAPSYRGNSIQGRRFAGTLDVLDPAIVIKDRKLLCMFISILRSLEVFLKINVLI